MTVSIGFTGTRLGMTRPQMRAVTEYLGHALLVHDTADPDTVAVHHGDCTGSDAQFHVMATVLSCWTVIHPPVLSQMRAFCEGDETRPPLNYLARDRAIVAESGELLATPDTAIWKPKSGTWTTIGYGVQAGHPVRVFLPDGTMASGRELLQGAGV